MDQILVKRAKTELEKVSQEQDMISSLPDHVLHEIVSLLPTRYAAITSVLSHRWLKIWLTFPWIQLDEAKFMNREQFFHCLRATLARHDLLNLKKLRLRMLHRPGSHELYQLINRFMDVVLLQGALKKLEIAFSDYVHLRSEELYVLPKELFSLSPSLIGIRIEGCRIDGCVPVNFPSLKTLWMKNVIFTTQEFLEELIQGCPVLRNLSIEYCNGTKSLRFSHPTLEKLVIGFCNKIGSLELDMPFVKSIKFKTRDPLNDERTQVLSYRNCDNIRARNLQTFRLKRFTMGSEVLHKMFSIFPKIEKINLRYCEILGNVKVFSDGLTTLRITNCILQEEAEIEAPNLQAITYLRNSRGVQLDSVKFMCLTRIFLASVQVSEILWINSSVCPNVVSLDLICCKNMKQLRIVASKLESLNVFECEDLESCVIVAFQLSYFAYTGQAVRMYPMYASPSLQLMLHLKGPLGFHDHGEMELYKFTRFLHKFNVSAKAVTIKLTYDCYMCLLMIKDVNVPLLSYDQLHLKIETRTQEIGLVDILRCALGISVCHNILSMDVGLFSITLQFQKIDKEETCLRNGNHACIEDHLVRIEVRNFQCSDEEVSLLRFLIGKATQVKHMKIWIAEGVEPAPQKSFNVSHWMLRIPGLLQQFHIVSHGSYLLFTKRSV